MPFRRTSTAWLSGPSLPVFLLLLHSFVLIPTVYSAAFHQLETGLTEGERQAILDLHNALRAQVARGDIRSQPQAADMVAMDWDDAVEERAQAWAQSCNSGPNDSKEGRHVDPYSLVGQNPGIGKIVRNIEDSLIRQWFNEYRNFRYTNDVTRRCNATCGHYTQIVWALTRKLGCGYARCPSSPNRRFMCNYAVGGNTDKQLPYIRGPPCTRCPTKYDFCMDGALCARIDQCRTSFGNCRCLVEEARCSKNGIYDKNTCHCKCNAGWTGSNCEIPCQDTRSDCRYQTDEKCKTTHEMFSSMLRDCKARCGYCNKDPYPHLFKNKFGIRVNALPQGTQTARVAPVTAAPSCRDNNKNCRGWAQSGMCTSNDYVRQNCYESCGRCGGPGVPVITRPPVVVTTRPPLGVCMDKHTSCESWALSGYCKTSSSVRDECQKSCGICGGNPVRPRPRITTTAPPVVTRRECRDQSNSCYDYARNAMCTQSSVMSLCPRSCGRCPGIPAVAPRTTPRPRVVTTTVCADRASSCVDYALRAYCTQQSIIDLCPRSCGRCPGIPAIQPRTTTTQRPIPTTTVCSDRAATCVEYALRGYCQQRSINDLCPRSCGRCPGIPAIQPRTTTYRPVITTTVCLDRAGSCIEYALNDYCRQASIYQLCPRSCGRCPGVPAVVPRTTTTTTTTTKPMCLDKNPNCIQYALNNYCIQASVMDLCPRSCGRCPGIPAIVPRTTTTSTTTTTTVNPLCIDRSQSCVQYGINNLCSQPNIYDLCPRTCGRCPGVPAVVPRTTTTTTTPTTTTTAALGCRDGDPRCPQFASGGYCKTSDYTRKNCRLSCNLCGLPPLPTTTACVDQDVFCTQWRMQGYCTRSQLIKSKCPLSCGMCGSPPPLPTTTTTTITTSSPTMSTTKPCEDKDKVNCDRWAQQNYCNSPLILQTCPKACGLCTCVDKSTMCDSWAKAGQCANRYVAENCQKSCKTCGKKMTGTTTTATPTTTPALCVDTMAQCDNWGKLGNCAKYEFVRTQCPKTCNTCNKVMTTTMPSTTMSTTTTKATTTSMLLPKCQDKNAGCFLWSTASNCKNEWMKGNCMKTCGYCGPTTTQQPTTTTAPCLDAVPACSLWKVFCTTSSYVKKSCCLTCSGGSPTTTTTTTTPTTTTTTTTPTTTTATTTTPTTTTSTTTSTTTTTTTATPTTPSCADKAGNVCKSWSKFCSSKYMRDFCQKTCGYCGPTTIATTPPPCVDKEAACSKWAQPGKCSSGFLINMCPKSCGLCAAMTTTSPCKDGSTSCPKWKASGYCTTSQFVADTCLQSCSCKPAKITTGAPTTTKRTTTSSTTTTPTTTTTTVGPKMCKDKSTLCAAWKLAGFCNMAITKSTCPKTCGLCGSTTTKPNPAPGQPCRDDLSYCAVLVPQTYCVKDPNIAKKCRKSCGFCGKAGRVTAPSVTVPTTKPTTTTTTTAAPVTSCVNKERLCDQWKKLGYCSFSGPYMKDVCPKACGFCGKPQPAPRSPSFPLTRPTPKTTKTTTTARTTTTTASTTTGSTTTAPTTTKKTTTTSTTKSTTTATTTSPLSTTSLPSCRDESKECKMWVGANMDFCRHSEYIIKNCQMTCGKCKKQPPKTCEDKTAMCSIIASGGSCKHMELVREKCPKTCKLC